MRILAINPNTSQFVTDKVCDVAQAALADGGEVVGVTGTSGPAIVGTRSECVIAAKISLDLAAQHAPGFDGVLLAISFDTGLDALREVLSIPVVGISEAGMLAATTFSRRFTVLTFGNRAVSLYEEMIDYYGLRTRSTGVLSLPPLSQVELENTDLIIPQLVDAVESAADTEGSECVILAGAIFAGIAGKIKDKVSVPIVDGIVAGTKLLELQHELDVRSPAKGSLSRPSPKILLGQSQSLTELFKNFPS